MMAAGTMIEVTKEMEEAGVEAFLNNYPDTGTGDVLDYRMVREIFVAMASAWRPLPRPLMLRPRTQPLFRLCDGTP